MYMLRRGQSQDAARGACIKAKRSRPWWDEPSHQGLLTFPRQGQPMGQPHGLPLTDH